MLRRIAYRALPRLLPPSTLHWLAEHVREWENLIKRGTTCWPFDAVIELENWCNRSCWYCPQSGQKYARLEMTDEMFSLALQRLREVGWDGQLSSPSLTNRLPASGSLSELEAPDRLCRRR